MMNESEMEGGSVVVMQRYDEGKKDIIWWANLIKLHHSN